MNERFLFFFFSFYPFLKSAFGTKYSGSSKNLGFKRFLPPKSVLSESVALFLHLLQFLLCTSSPALDTRPPHRSASPPLSHADDTCSGKTAGVHGYFSAAYEENCYENVVKQKAKGKV